MITFHLYPPVTVQTEPIIGASTEAKQDAQIAILNTLGTQATLAALLTELELKADLTETQPVSAAALPLPTGASTEATLAALLAELQLKADLLETQPVSAATLPLPTGAATEASQASTITAINAVETDVEAGNVLLTSINAKDFATQTTLAALLTELQLKADLSETQPVSAATLPLPTGAATQTTLEAVLTELQLKADLSETQPVSAAALPLPAGASTEATLELVRLALLAQEAALAVAAFTRVDFAATNVTDLADVEIVASSGAYKAARFFYAGGQPIYLKVDGVNEMIIPPGADFEIRLDIATASAIALRAVVASTTIQTGQLIINWLG